MSWPCPPPCPPQPCPSYQPLPISTGNVGIDRCGNIEVYAAPNTVHRQVCWSIDGSTASPRGRVLIQPYSRIKNVWQSFGQMEKS